MFIGPQLVFDPVRRRADLAFDGTDLILDLTPATTMLVSIGSDRRAYPDEELPDVNTNDYAPNRLNARAGYPGDALDAQGRLIGSRLWLLKRRKQDEPSRQLAENATAEALAHFETDHNMPVTVTVRYLVRNMIGILAQVARAKIALHLPVGG